MSTKHGNLSINSENLFPIIKKWLYSDHDIFVRELVSNGCDAITKLKKLEMMGECELPEDYEAKIRVVVNPEEKSIQFIDTGLGMTEAEVDEYINQIAFSGAADFIEKYKDKTNDDQIIGHFGLGFYSAFMVADEVTIDTLSYQKDAKAVHWSCDGGTEFDISDGNKSEVGTCITLYLNEDCVEFSNEYRMREVLNKYCSFMPTEIFMEKANAEPEYETILPEEKTDKDVVIETVIEEAKTEERETPDGGKEVVEVSPKQEKLKILKRPVALNDPAPLWTKHPNECSEEDYKTFFRKVFNDYKEPLFWIHLNMDYPFNLKGILYFPKIDMEYDSIEGVIKLYNNQVFVADNIKEVIPEFLMLLKGVIDCPDFPLNVSRSALQNDGFVKKISDYISKKVADKLSGMCKTEREDYEKYWDDISPFIKFGCIKDDKFSEKIMDYILYKNIDGKYLTLEDMIKEAKGEELSSEAESSEAEETSDTVESASKDSKADDVEVVDSKAEESTEEKEPEKTTLYYVTDEQQQSQYINMFREQKQDAVILNHKIDQPFISHVEAKREDVKFQRIDADLTESFKDELSEEDSESLKQETDTLSELFKKALSNDKLNVKVEKLKNNSISSMVTLSEESRRMQDMMKMYSMYGMGGMNMGEDDVTLILNSNHELVQYLLNHKDSEHASLFCEQLYDLAMMAHKPLESEAMTKFISRSNQIMMLHNSLIL